MPVHPLSMSLLCIHNYDRKHAHVHVLGHGGRGASPHVRLCRDRGLSEPGPHLRPCQFGLLQPSPHLLEHRPLLRQPPSAGVPLFGRLEPLLLDPTADRPQDPAHVVVCGPQRGRRLCVCDFVAAAR